jgi:glycosyltransferase involved in cell wall biosynthesis
VKVALVHDYLTQRGGAERVVLSLTKAFPGAPLYTSLYDADATFAEFGEVDVRPLALDSLPVLRRNHRLALPLLATAFSRLRISADAVVCSSSGWAHGTRVDGRKIVYCHTPARWLYQGERYLRRRASPGGLALSLLRPVLARWDATAAASADRYLANSTVVRERIRQLYGREAEVVPPPHAIDPAGPGQPIDGLEPGFLLCVSRLLPYKNVGAVVEALARRPELTLALAGSGPDEALLRSSAPGNVRVLGRVSDEELRWLYHGCRGLVSAAYEDFGLTPLEAAAFGKPSAVLRFGGFVDTVREAETGVFFEEPVAEAIAAAIDTLRERTWDDDGIRAHAAGFSESTFLERMQAIVLEQDAGTHA